MKYSSSQSIRKQELPERAKLKRALKQLASSLPHTQYAYKGVMYGDEIKDDMKIKRTRAGEVIRREEQYEVNKYNFVNHKRRLYKIIKTAKNEIDMQRKITAYIALVKQEYETFLMLHPVKRSWLQRFTKRVKSFFIN